MKKFYLLLTLVISISALFGASKGNPITEKSKIKIQNVSFEENGKMQIQDEEGNAIALYDRFENKNIQALNIKNARIYDLNNQLIMTLVISFEGTTFAINLLNKDKKTGFVKQSVLMKKMKAEKIFNVDHFNKKYSVKSEQNQNIKMAENETFVYLDDQTVVYKLRTIDFKDQTKSTNMTDYDVDKNFLKNNKEDAAVWSLICMMMAELSF